MAHYAFLDDNNIVTEVITGRDEDEVVDGVSDWEAHYSAFRGQRCLRTSYNTKYNNHIDGGVAFRGNYAGVGFLYLEDEDIFVEPQPFPSWVLSVGQARWNAPVEPPATGLYVWDEESGAWVEA
jgi:hypothetical protein